MNSSEVGSWKLITGQGNSLNPDKRHALGIQSLVQNWRRGKYDFDIEVMTQEKNHTQLEQRGEKNICCEVKRHLFHIGS